MLTEEDKSWILEVVKEVEAKGMEEHEKKVTLHGYCMAFLTFVTVLSSVYALVSFMLRGV